MARHPVPDLLPGTLDLLILRTLQTESLHGWAISERIQQISQDVLQINQGSLYPALHRLEHQCRDTRGVGFVDDLTRDVLYAFRTFRRAPLAALTVIATVAFGLGLVAVVFTVYNFLMLRVDAVQSPGELFAVKLWRPADS